MTEEERGNRIITETEPFNQLFMPDDDAGDHPPNRWMQIRGYEMYQYADLWAYRYKLHQIPAWWGGYVHWFGDDLTEAGDEEGYQADPPLGDFAFGRKQEVGGWLYCWDDNHETVLGHSKYKAAYQVIDHMRNLCNELVQLSQQKHAERHPDPRSHLAEWDAWMNERRRIVRHNQRRRTSFHFEKLGGLLDMYDPDSPSYMPPHPGFLQ